MSHTYFGVSPEYLCPIRFGHGYGDPLRVLVLQPLSFSYLRIKYLCRLQIKLYEKKLKICREPAVFVIVLELPYPVSIAMSLHVLVSVRAS